EKTVRWCRRNRVLAGSLAAAVLALLTGTVVSVSFGIQASRRAAQAEWAETKARASEAEANRQLAQAHLERGLALCEQGDVNRGLHWLLESLRITPAEDATFRRLLRTNLAAWTETAPALRCAVRPQGKDGRAVFSPDGKTLVTTGLVRTAS